MAFEDVKDELNEIKDNTRNYIESSISYYSLLGLKISAKAALLLFRTIVFSLLALLSLLLFSFAAAYAIGKYYGSYATGFVIVGIFYLLICILFYFKSDKIFEKPIIKALSDIFYKE